MNNIILISIETIICYLSLILLYKKYKIDGIYIYAIIGSIITCIMTLKQINIMSICIPSGLGVATSLIIGGNIITQKKGPDGINTYLQVVLVTLLLSCCFLNLTGLMENSIYNQFANNSYSNIFKYNLRIYIALIISIISSIWISSHIYHLLKKIQNKIIVSNIFSIIIIEVLENIIFCLAAYLFEFKIVDLILCIVFRYMIKTIIGIFGTIPLYISNKVK